MDISLLLQMTAEAFPDRVAVGSRADGLTYARLLDAARQAAALVADRPADRVGLVDVSSAALPVLLFGAALAGRVFAPVNYRLADDRLRALTARTGPAFFVAGPADASRIAGIHDVQVMARGDFLAALPQCGQNQASGFKGIEQRWQAAGVSGDDAFCSVSASHGSGFTGASRTQARNRQNNATPRPARAISPTSKSGSWVVNIPMESPMFCRAGQEGRQRVVSEIDPGNETAAG